MKGKTIFILLAVVVCAVLTLGSAPSTSLNIDGAPATATQNYVTDESIDPLMVQNVPAGGTEFVTMGSVTGYVQAGRPDARIQFTAPNPRIPVYIAADLRNTDLVIFVHGPDGRWYSNDDTFGTMPGVALVNCPSGIIDVWVGTKNSGAPVSATVILTITAPAWASQL